MRKRRVSSQRSREITAIIILALAVFLFITLISHDSRDPFFNHRGIDQGKIYNYGGIIGAYVSGSLIKVLGLASGWIPVILFLISFRLFLQALFVIDVLVVSGLIGLVASTSGLLTLLGWGFSISGVNYDPGGILGTVLIQSLHPYLSGMGTSIFLFLVLILSLMITMDLSISELGGSLPTCSGVRTATSAGGSISFRKSPSAKSSSRRKSVRKRPGSRRS